MELKKSIKEKKIEALDTEMIHVVVNQLGYKIDDRTKNDYICDFVKYLETGKIPKKYEENRKMIKAFEDLEIYTQFKNKILYNDKNIKEIENKFQLGSYGIDIKFKEKIASANLINKF